MNFPYNHRVLVPHLGLCDRTVLDEQHVVIEPVPGRPEQIVTRSSGWSFLSAALLVSVWLVIVL